MQFSTVFQSYHGDSSYYSEDSPVLGWGYEVSCLAQTIFFPRIDDSHCDTIHSSLTTVRCSHKGYVGKQAVAWKEYCVEYWLKELQESMDGCTCCCYKTEILLKMALNTILSINQPKPKSKF